VTSTPGQRDVERPGPSANDPGPTAATPLAGGHAQPRTRSPHASVHRRWVHPMATNSAIADDNVERAEVRETHSAIVLLTGDHAYKIKKPVDLGFLDFRSAQSRKDVCARELELNRRLAPDVYLDLITIAGSEATAYEYGLMMRRMPTALRLSTMVKHGADVDDHLRALARLIARFHATAATSARIAAEGSATGLRRRWVDNLRETERFDGDPLPSRLHEQVSRLALAYVDGRAPLLTERADAGLVVDGHGDLIAEDIFCLPDYPRILDCIEFDDRLRWLDVLDDVAFLAMDLEHLGRSDLVELFLRSYLEFSGSPTVDSLEHHYIAYRAFVRAKVCCIQAAQGRTDAALEAASYAALALQHLRAGEVSLVLVGGSPGTGKTTLAASLADELGCVLLSTDTVRRDLNIDAEQRYGAPARAAVYDALLLRARDALQRGESVVADATWADPQLRDRAAEVAAATSSRIFTYECQTPIDLAAQRAQARLERGKDSSEAGADVARSIAGAWAPMVGAIAIDTSGTFERSLESALTSLREHAGEAPNSSA
jgi:aminoglycoside phosphotransferase family enzyme/predicted kinase